MLNATNVCKVGIKIPERHETRYRANQLIDFSMMYWHFGVFIVNFKYSQQIIQHANL